MSPLKAMVANILPDFWLVGLFLDESGKSGWAALCSQTLSCCRLSQGET